MARTFHVLHGDIDGGLRTTAYPVLQIKKSLANRRSVHVI